MYSSEMKRHDGCVDACRSVSYDVGALHYAAARAIGTPSSFGRGCAASMYRIHAASPMDAINDVFLLFMKVSRLHQEEQRAVSHLKDRLMKERGTLEVRKKTVRLAMRALEKLCPDLRDNKRT